MYLISSRALERTYGDSIMSNFTKSTLGPQVLILLLNLVSICMTSPVFPKRTTTSTLPTIKTTEFIQEDYNLTTTQANITCSGAECHSTSRLDVATTVLYRLLIIAGCIIAFVALVKVSDLINRRCRCKGKQDIYFTRI